MFRKITLKSVKNNFKIHPGNPRSKNNRNDSEFQIDLMDLAKLIFINKKFIVSFACLVMLVTAVVVFVLPKKYTSTASILPSGNSDKFSTIKQISGLGIGGFEADENSSVLFPTILKSNSVIDAVMDNRLSFYLNGELHTMTYQDYLKIDNRDLARDYLRKQLDIGYNKNTGVISLAMESKSPELSQQLLDCFLEELDNFNMNKRRSLAKDNVSYLKRELTVKENQMKEAEDALESFQLSNRNWANTSDPNLLKTLGRLKRDVQAKLNTYIFLREQYEISLLDVQKDIPIVTILDNPSLPAIKSSPKRLSTILLSGAVALFFAILLLIANDAYRKRKYDKTEIPNEIVRRTASTPHKVTA